MDGVAGPDYGLHSDGVIGFHLVLYFGQQGGNQPWLRPMPVLYDLMGMQPAATAGQYPQVA